jgi:hypothetical protein
VDRVGQRDRVEGVGIAVEVGLLFGVARLPGSGALALDATNEPAQVAIVLDKAGVVVRVPICIESAQRYNKRE